MKDKELMSETIALIDLMIQHSDKGPSGFWVEDDEGCGNPEIFPEFAESIKTGRLIFKKHCICPWNTAVLYGKGHGNPYTGCSYSCSIMDARRLPKKMLNDILLRFKRRLLAGDFDDLQNIKPLLTKEEQAYIKKQENEANRIREERIKSTAQQKRKNAIGLLQKYSDNEKISRLIKSHYGDSLVVQLDNGCIDFSPSKKSEINGAHEISYDEFLNLQIQSLGKSRHGFEKIYYNCGKYGCFKGEIIRINQTRICFKRIFIEGMYISGDTYTDKEDHVWMDRKGFESFKVGDCLKFYAEVYRYIKTGRGKLLDYALRNPECIMKIDGYRVPDRVELGRQALESLVCELCPLSYQCYGFCINEEWRSAFSKCLLPFEID